MSNAPIRELKRQLSHNWNTRNDNFPGGENQEALAHWLQAGLRAGHGAWVRIL